MIQNNMFGTECIVSHFDTKVNGRQTMKHEKNIRIAFLLNLSFSVLEFLGGLFTGSVAIISDAVHDFGDALSVGIAWFLEKKSVRNPDDIYTYGYRRFSVLGGLITTIVLFFASVFVLHHAVMRLLSPVPVHASGMLIIAVLGVLINGAAAHFTHDDHSINGRAINLHMLEDVLGWVVVLVGAVVIRFTDFYFIDPLLSIAVACFILVHVFKNLFLVLRIFLEKIPEGISVQEIKGELLQIEGVKDVPRLCVRTLDGETHAAALHIITDGDATALKKAVREKLMRYGIGLVTIETE